MFIKIFKNLLPLVFLFVASNSNGQGTTSAERYSFYLEEANTALKNNDISYACDLMRHGLRYAKDIGGKIYAAAEKQTNTTCSAALAQAKAEFDNQRKPFEAVCRRANAAKRLCSQAAHYDSCMKNNFGLDYKLYDNLQMCL